MKDFYTTKEVAEQLQLNTTTITYYVRIGELNAIKLGNSYRIEKDELARFLERRKTNNRNKKEVK